MQEFIKSKGYSFPSIDENKWMVVLESNAKYIKSARMGDDLNTLLKVSLISKKILRFDFDIMRNNDHICQGHILHICIDKNSWKSTELPQAFIDSLIKKV